MKGRFWKIMQVTGMKHIFTMYKWTDVCFLFPTYPNYPNHYALGGFCLTSSLLPAFEEFCLTSFLTTLFSTMAGLGSTTFGWTSLAPGSRGWWNSLCLSQCLQLLCPLDLWTARLSSSWNSPTALLTEWHNLFVKYDHAWSCCTAWSI